MHVSLILTALNEAGSLPRLLDSLAEQTRLPDEIIVADGGSTDGSQSVLAGYADRLPLRVVAAPGSNIAQGRNAAIRESSGDIIAVTDAGVWLDRRWLEELVGPFQQEEAPTPAFDGTGTQERTSLVAGFFVAEAGTPFEIAMGATVLPDLKDVNPSTFLPSSRSAAFRRHVWRAAGGYPEWLDFCEDVAFDLAVRRLFGPFTFKPSAIVHFRPRNSLRAFARQYFQYARGDGKAGLFTRIHAIRYLTYLVVAPLIGYAGLAVSPWLWLLYLVSGLAYVRRPYERLWARLNSLAAMQKVEAIILVPIIRVVGDLAKMAGYPAGVAWRLTHPRPTRKE